MTNSEFMLAAPTTMNTGLVLKWRAQLVQRARRALGHVFLPVGIIARRVAARGAGLEATAGSAFSVSR